MSYKRFVRRFGRLLHEPIGDPIIQRTLIPQSTSGDGGAATFGAAFERWYALEEQTSLGTARSTFGMAQMTATGTAAAFQDTTGSYINYTSTTLASAIAGWTNTTTDVVQTQLLPDLLVVMKTGANATDVQNLRIWFGLQNNGLGALGTDTPGATSAGTTLLFRYSTPGGDTTWHATSADGASDTATDTGVAVTANTRYALRIRVVTTSSVEYSINGTLVATLTTTLPAGTTGLQPRVYTVNAGVGTARNIRLRKYYLDAL